MVKKIITPKEHNVVITPEFGLVVPIRDESRLDNYSHLFDNGTDHERVLDLAKFLDYKHGARVYLGGSRLHQWIFKGERSRGDIDMLAVIGKDNEEWAKVLINKVPFKGKEAVGITLGNHGYLLKHRFRTMYMNFRGYVERIDAAEDISHELYIKVNGQYKKLIRKGFSDQQAYNIITTSIEFILNHMEVYIKKKG